VAQELAAAQPYVAQQQQQWQQQQQQCRLRIQQSALGFSKLLQLVTSKITASASSAAAAADHLQLQAPRQLTATRLYCGFSTV
jgi:hypothetical protein